MEQPVIKNVLNISMEIPQTKIAKFWEELKRGKLFATKCAECGEIYFPPKADCSKCYSSKMDWIELSGNAELITWTIIHVCPKSFSQHSPYVIAVAKLEEGCSVMAWLTNIKHEDIKPGIKLKLIPKEFGYEFIPS
jgi:uncharacterized OB-fold protein